MKLLSVSLLLALSTACVDDPLAPVPRPPKLPGVDEPVVITGRIVSARSATGVQAANVRIVDAKASVGTDEMGRYRIVLPARYRGQTVAVNVRAIGYKQQNRTVTLTSDVTIVDLPVAMESLQFTCFLEIVVRRNEATDEPAPIASLRSATKIKHRVRIAR